ncbi:MAG: ergothioneine biosynthesis protein EgtB [Actinomycetota bacterium]
MRSVNRTTQGSEPRTVIRRLFETRDITEALGAPLSEADQTVQSMPDCSPTKWHRAHTTWFFETFVLGPHLAGYEPFDENYSYLFNSYYEQVGERYPRPRRGLVTRPGIEGIARYRRHVDDALHRLLDDADAETAAELAPLIELGINHEQQHQELLLMDIKNALTANLFDTAYDQRPHEPVGEVGPVGWHRLEGGTVSVGLEPVAPEETGSFRFDNEEPRHDVLVPSFELADRLVTCGEWLAFMEAGGYDEPTLWLSDGWYTRLSEEWQAPLYWSRSDDGWWIHTLTGSRPVDPNEPVCHISFYEADAYANWAGARLPTEFEWEHAALTARSTTGALLASDAIDGMSAVDSSRLHPDGAGRPSGALRQLIGDCWEWTGSPYRPYPGFSAPEGAIGEYNGKFMINTMVLRGGCALTPAGHERPTYRNFFHPHTRWHLSGVRLARD